MKPRLLVWRTPLTVTLAGNSLCHCYYWIVSNGREVLKLVHPHFHRTRIDHDCAFLGLLAIVLHSIISHLPSLNFLSQ